MTDPRPEPYNTDDIPDPLSAHRTALPALREALADWDARDQTDPGAANHYGTELSQAARALIAALDNAGINPVTIQALMDVESPVGVPASTWPPVVVNARGIPDRRPWVTGPAVVGPPLPRSRTIEVKVLRCLACKTPNEVPANEDTVICWACGKASQPLTGWVQETLPDGGVTEPPEITEEVNTDHDRQ